MPSQGIDTFTVYSKLRYHCLISESDFLLILNIWSVMFSTGPCILVFKVAVMTTTQALTPVHDVPENACRMRLNQRNG
ncbi:hypothetical protein PAXRUDRAFT_822322 [Paxillus rubicundulus Ve08.2h10]|uniref:Uncharacterized protein n=1 Tax=Paxillus rubicundulus Ve08.2h10 TaxID=930991 RepID=A0A0D0ECQ7_9AGAM|nr:hypothetical protein PAXRUDRAFT_822322 [Paxillus rubicundulus Ve08.2h10]